jgi:hypothetical protein
MMMTATATVLTQLPNHQCSFLVLTPLMQERMVSHRNQGKLDLPIITTLRRRKVPTHSNDLPIKNPPKVQKLHLLLLQLWNRLLLSLLLMIRLTATIFCLYRSRKRRNLNHSKRKNTYLSRIRRTAS